MAIKMPPRTKLATSSQISEKPISSTFVLLMKHSHENHIIMVPLRILMRFFYRLSCKNIQMSANLSKKLFNNSNIIEVKAWQLDTL